MRVSRRSQLTIYAILIAAAAVMVVPFVMMISTSLKPHAYVLEIPPRLVPDEPTLDNYARAWTSQGFARYFLNSTIVTGAHVVGVLLFSSMMAYAFARFEFRGKRVLFLALLATLMIPAMMLIIPQFLIARDLGLIDTRLGLVVFYVASQLAFLTFLLRGFFEGIPRELEEAMEIDGASPVRIYWHLMLPLSRPALATAGIFAFLAAWDEFVWALTIINDPALRTLPIAIALFQGAHATQWGLVFAASIIAIVPVIVVFVVFQRHFVAGLQAGALKG
jgi:multiple sugar transport system permease protein